jgi:hypothetical protein
MQSGGYNNQNNNNNNNVHVHQGGDNKVHVETHQPMVNNQMNYNNNIRGGGQPGVVMIAQNQVVVTDPKLIQLTPVPLFCGRCNTTVFSRVVTACSCANVCCCIMFGPIWWLIFQCCRDKAYSCQNASHFCPNCSTPIGQYDAC